MPDDLLIKSFAGADYDALDERMLETRPCAARKFRDDADENVGNEDDALAVELPTRQEISCLIGFDRKRDCVARSD